MIKWIKIRRYANLAVAWFDTKVASGKDKGRRVKHYVYKSKDGIGFWHEWHWLSSEDIEPEESYDLIISERKFFGRFRLVKARVKFMPNTWAAIATSVEKLCEMEDEE